ncbi:MAG: hypothetical protein P8X42_07795 [Calditrichaceae bacterium]
MSVKVTIGKKEYFPGIEKIKYEGPDSQNPLAFKYYDENKVVAGKSMKDHFRFAIAYWHTFCNTGEDPFGGGPQDLPWLNDDLDSMEEAQNKLDAWREKNRKNPVLSFSGERQMYFQNRVI